MTRYEWLTLLVSLLAVVVAVVSLIRTRKIQDKQLEFQKLAAELSAKQLEMIKKSEEARINVRLEEIGTKYRFVIINEGKAVAKDIYFSLDGRAGDNPLVPDEYAKKIPIPTLHPGNSATLQASLHQQSARRYTILVRWKNSDGRQVSDEIFTSI